MKINAVNLTMANSKVRSAHAPSFALNTSICPRIISLSEYKSCGLSFTGNTDRNKEQVIFIGAESDPYSKAGGVGTVMKDYRSYTKPENQVEIIPYYGAENKKTTGTKPLQDKDGNYYMHTNKGDIALELVSKKTMQWGRETDSEILLFRPKNDKKRLTYFVFSDDVSSMEKPYQNAYVYRSGAKQKTHGWNGDPYAKFSKASIEFLPEIMKDKPNFNPATIVCSDSQTAYAVEYMAQKTLSDTTKSDYDGIKPTYVGHNLGPGYCGETSMQNMFVNLGATPEQIDMIEDDPIYQDGIKGDEYFKPYVEKTLDETGVASAVEIPLYWADKGYVKSFSVVAEDYAESIANNPQAAHNIHDAANKLYQTGVFNGILNPLNDPAVDASKPLLNRLYNEDCTDKDGKIYKKFEIYPENPTFEEVKKIKNANKLNLLERLQAKDTTIITGNPERTAKINPELKTSEVIKPELLELIRSGKGDNVPLFVSWGRIDTQKGHDITLSSFEKFAKTKEGKNAILILGAGLDKSEESKKIESKIKKMLKDPELKGRIVHIDGWAPAYAMASAADAAIFSSRFEPCGLTDLEAMKYYCTPIVTNTQGLKQKNFDPRIASERKRATSYRTQHEYNLLKSDITMILKACLRNDTEAKKNLEKNFPTFFVIDENGNKVFDDTLFKDFALAHGKFLEEKKEEIESSVDYEGKMPDNWYDWDELSKDYSFKFGGYSRDLKDGILISEMADSIASFASADAETKELLFNNLKKLKTGWKSNANLHPEGKSSYELYKSRHLDSEYTEPKKDDKLDVADKDVEKTIEEEQTSDLTKRAETYGLGSLTGILGLIFGRLGKQTANEEKALLEGKINELNSHIAELENAAVNNSKNANKKIILIGTLSAAAAAVITGIITHIVSKNNAKKNNTLVQPDTVQLSTNVQNGTVLNFSLEQFKNSLNKKN